jgi:hypothetical protein
LHHDQLLPDATGNLETATRRLHLQTPAGTGELLVVWNHLLVVRKLGIDADLVAKCLVCLRGFSTSKLQNTHDDRSYLHYQTGFQAQRCSRQRHLTCGFSRRLSGPQQDQLLLGLQRQVLEQLLAAAACVELNTALTGQGQQCNGKKQPYLQAQRDRSF